MNRDVNLFRHFGLDARTTYWGPEHQKYATGILNAVRSQRMMIIIGGFGNGKSTLVRVTLNREARFRVVWVNNPDRERLRISRSCRP